MTTNYIWGPCSTALGEMCVGSVALPALPKKVVPKYT